MVCCEIHKCPGALTIIATTVIDGNAEGRRLLAYAPLLRHLVMDHSFCIVTSGTWRFRSSITVPAFYGT